MRHCIQKLRSWNDEEVSKILNVSMCPENFSGSQWVPRRSQCVEQEIVIVSQQMTQIHGQFRKVEPSYTMESFSLLYYSFLFGIFMCSKEEEKSNVRVGISSCFVGGSWLPEKVCDFWVTQACEKWGYWPPFLGVLWWVRKCI